MTVIDLAAARAAGAVHGQLVSPLRDGGIGLSGHKLVDEGARALLLYVPGILRIDVKPLEDGLRVIPRALGGAQLGWEIDPSALTDYGKTAEETPLPALTTFRLALLAEEGPLAGRVLISYTRAFAHGPTHFAAHAILQQVHATGDVS
jgi:hypothetical protein